MWKDRIVLLLIAIPMIYVGIIFALFDRDNFKLRDIPEAILDSWEKGIL